MESVTITGTVRKHRGRGTTLGFPTANIMLEQPIKQGVYAGYTKVQNSWFDSAIFVGQPDMDTTLPVQVESHLLNYHGQLNEQEISVELVEYIRSPQRYETDEQLVKAISSDIKAITQCLAELPKRN